MLTIQFVPVKTNKQILIRTIITFIPLLLFGMLRTGNLDYEEYEEYYNYVHGLSISSYEFGGESREVGWFILNSLSPSYRFVIIIQAIIVISSYIYFFYKYIPPKFHVLGIILLFISAEKTFLFSFCGMRNAIAIALLLFSLPSIFNRNIRRFAVLTLCAACFHISSLFVFPLCYFIGRGGAMKKFEVFIWLSALIILLILPLEKIALTILPLFDTSAFARYYIYADDVVSMGILSRLSSIIMIVGMLYYLSESKSENMLVMGRLAMLFMFSPLFGSLNLRFFQYFIYFLIAAVVYMNVTSKKGFVSRVYTFFICIYLSYAFFVIDCNSEYSSLLTYITPFSK